MGTSEYYLLALARDDGDGFTLRQREGCTGLCATRGRLPALPAVALPIPFPIPVPLFPCAPPLCRRGLALLLSFTLPIAALRVCFPVGSFALPRPAFESTLGPLLAVALLTRLLLAGWAKATATDGVG